jgi:TPR repeat protein
VTKDLEEAKRLYELAADQGHAQAKTALAGLKK